MTRRPLNGLFRRAVQCRDQSVVDRLLDRSHPNKVSMKKRKKKKNQRLEGQAAIYRLLWTRSLALVLREVFSANRIAGARSVVLPDS